MNDAPDPQSDTPPDNALAFAPVPLRARHDGWTPEKQAAFLEALAETACVEEACRRVGMSVQSAYRLRRREPAVTFRKAWNLALDHAMHRLEEAALSRAIRGVPRPIFYQGEQVGEWREFDDKLTMFLLRYRRPQRFGAWLDQAPQRDDDGETAGELEFHLGNLVELETEDVEGTVE